MLSVKQNLEAIVHRASIINHEKNILSTNSFKHAHLYCKINKLPNNSFGMHLEKYVTQRYNYKHHKSADGNGDFGTQSGRNIEIKSSLGGSKNNQFNYLQIRFFQDVDYILTAFYVSKENIENEGELFIFSLPKEDMKNIVLKFGHYAHGTKNELPPITMERLNDPSIRLLYAIRPRYGGKCWNELLKYRIDDLPIF